MGNIIELKTYLEKNIAPKFPLIFVYKDVKFVAEQYIQRICDILKEDVEYIDQLKGNKQKDLFSTNKHSKNIRVYVTDELIAEKDILQEDKLIIVTKKVKSREDLENYIYEIPKLQDDWIKDYLYTGMKGVDTKALDKLFEDCKKDIYRIHQEVSKVRIFKEQERSTLFQQMVDDGTFSDISSKNIFDFSNALLQKDYQRLSYLLSIISVIDCEPLGLVTILYQNFKKYIQVWLAKNPTEENTGIKSNVIYAISKAPRTYNKEQLLKCFDLLCGIDYKLKTGQIDTKWLVDYLVCKVLTI